MSSDQQFFLKWNDFQTNMVTSFRHLRDEKSFTDENPSKHPIIILKDVSYIHLQAILEFMYAGEVNVSQEQLPAFLKTADRLKVKGLAETPSSIKREG
uniref:BTB domain-containing protein n=1 Tax=Glossina pallidipes TaxID=7398 RepID=A0A1A9Z0M1_GLOPL